MLTASHPHCVSLNRAATARRSTFQKSQTRRAALIAIPRRILISCPTEGTQAADKGASASLASLRHPSTYREYASGCRGARRLAAGPFSTACRVRRRLASGRFFAACGTLGTWLEPELGEDGVEPGGHAHRPGCGLERRVRVLEPMPREGEHDRGAGLEAPGLDHLGEPRHRRAGGRLHEDTLFTCQQAIPADDLLVGDGV